jgi:hypothetical protein
MAEITKKPGENSESDQTGQAARQLRDKATEAVKRSVETTADVTRRAADQSREATISGLRAIAGVQGPLADAGFEQSRRTLEITSALTDVYRQAAERAGGDVRALFDSSMSFGRGLQQWQQAYVDAVRQSLEGVASKRQDFLQSNSPLQFAEVQRDLYVDLVNTTLKASTTLLQLAAQISQDALRPLQERAQTRA